jgi:cysteine desulfurase/selenocysteine lyase
MTLAYRGGAAQGGAGSSAAQEDEIVFVRGATEGINLVAHSWGGAQLQAGRPHPALARWSITAISCRGSCCAERMGIAQIDVVPHHGKMGGSIWRRWSGSSRRSTRWWRWRMSRTCSVPRSTSGISSALSRTRWAPSLLIDGCQAVPRLAVDVRQLGCRFLRLLGAQALWPDRHRRAVGTCGKSCSMPCLPGRAAAQ